jgi:hypothetical protein
MTRPDPLPRDPEHPYGSPEHNLTEEQLAERFPFAVTLRFYDQEQFSAFLGGLLDGWGENYCDFIWPGWGAGHESKIFACTFADGEDDE